MATIVSIFSFTLDAFSFQAQLSRLYEARHYRKQDFQFGDQFSPAEPPPSIPNVTHPFIYQLWNPHEITADERPVPAETTLAIHTLNGIPLQKPHGKKMVRTTDFD
jgi:hypothetical protein